MSHFLYIHKDLSGNLEYNKIGVTLTPYSAVRARQKFCADEFALDHLFFGREKHIDHLESLIKQNFETRSGKVLTGRGQTELFKVSQQELLDFINKTIAERSYHICKVQLKKPYAASKSGDCPYNVPSEQKAWHWAEKLVEQHWGPDPDRVLLEGLYKGLKQC